MKPYYADDAITLWHGDALEVLTGMADGSVDCCVTSPPYYGLRDYGVDGQYGLEASPVEYVETMRAVFAQVRRVLADDGVLWLNIGDSYYSGKGNPGPNAADTKQPARRGWVRPVDLCGQEWAKPKDLLGIPWRLAFALQDNGWTLRNAVIWAKPNAMPESVTDRLSNRYEHVFLFSKSRRYWFDLDPIRESLGKLNQYPIGPKASEAAKSNGWNAHGRADGHMWTVDPDKGRNPGDVWTITTSPFPGAHFATMPLTLASKCISSGCKPNGTVIDPFSGSGTTGLAAQKLGRRYVGIDLNAEYLDLSLRTRLAQGALLDGGAA